MTKQRKPAGTALFILAFFLLAARLPAQDAAEDAGSSLVLKLAVMGPGDELYFWWGHIGLIIEDAGTGDARFYDWGIFSFENENFFANFAFGRLLYSCGSSQAARNINYYIGNNRDITVYTLDIPADKKEEVRSFAEWNVRPENRDYYYHHFKDNCSTRIRDILDMATSGAFKARYGDAPGRYTLRQHVRRHTWFSPFFDWILNFWMGQDIDKPITVWDEMFLPAEVGARIQDFSYTGGDGVERRLVSRVERVNNAVGRPPVLEVPRKQWPRELALGCVVAVFMAVLLFFKSQENRAADLVWAIAQGCLGFFFGAVGTILLFMMAFTNHDYTYHNINILYINPLLLAALPLGILYALTYSPQEKRKWELIIKILWSYVLGFGLLSLLLRALPNIWQQNQVTLTMVLPFAAVLSLLPDGLARFRREYLWRWLN
ncbi:MAG: DUF4105 domain-containing protein [Treponema sp.]|nr:DUF4105 domain-containing protein [Treponema sp.]